LEQILEHLSMDGYAKFVWPAFAIAAAVMAVLAFVSRRTLRARQTELEALRRARAATSAATGTGDQDET
jgi:heme exporter protein D